MGLIVSKVSLLLISIFEFITFLLSRFIFVKNKLKSYSACILTMCLKTYPSLLQKSFNVSMAYSMCSDLIIFVSVVV